MADICQGSCMANHLLMYHIEERWPLDYACPIYGQAFPFFFAMLLISNIFVVLVLSRRHMVSPTNTVLKYMAIADLFVGLVRNYRFFIILVKWALCHCRI